MRHWSLKHTGAAAAVLCAAAVWLWFHPLKPGGIDLDKTYRIGFGIDRPFHFPTAASKPTGLAVEIVDKAAQRRGVKLDWIPVGSGVPALRAGEIDLYILLTIRPARRALVHMTDPYLITETSFLVRSDSPVQQTAHLLSSRISFIDVEVHRMDLGKYFPQAVLMPQTSTKEAIVAVREGRADAAYVDQFAAITALLDNQVQTPVRIVGAGGTKGLMALASTFEHAPVADAVREEMRAMTADGTTSQILGRWGFFSSLTTEATDALEAEQRRVRRLRAGLAVAGGLLLAVAWLAWRLRGESAALKQAQIALSDSERHHRMLVDSLPDVLYMANPEGNISLNARNGETGGQEELIRTLQQSAAHTQSVRESIETGRTIIGEESTSDDRFVEYRLFPMDNRKRRTPAVMGILRDVTDRKRSERARAELEEQLRQSQTLEGIGRLAGGVAHDFNNLLTVINGYSESVLESPGLDAAIRRQVEGIHIAGAAAAELTQQLLAFGRKQVALVRRLDLNALIREMEGLIRRVLDAKVSLIHALRPSNGSIVADPAQISQILLNLASNARDAMPRGGSLLIETADVELVPGDGAGLGLVDGSYVRLSVTDTGMGMNEETKARLFEPFFTTKEMGQGTGLGLATVYGIVKQLGGHIRVESEPSHGTTFEILLPRNLDPPPVSAERPLQPAVPSGTETILVVEDQNDVRTLVRDMLKRLGYRVLDVGEPGEALAIVAKVSGPIDLLVTDVVLPGMSGTELAQRLAGSNPSLKVLFMSGYTQNAIGGELPRGAAFLQKPFTLSSLGTKVRALLDQPK